MEREGVITTGEIESPKPKDCDQVLDKNMPNNEAVEDALKEIRTQKL